MNHKICLVVVFLINLFFIFTAFNIHLVEGLSIPSNVTEVHIINKEHIPVDEKWSWYLLIVAIITLLSAITTIGIAMLILYVEPRMRRKEITENSYNTLKDAIRFTKSQLSVRDKWIKEDGQEFGHPYFWAPFILIGY